MLSYKAWTDGRTGYAIISPYFDGRIKMNGPYPEITNISFLAKLFFKTFISLKQLFDCRTIGPSDYRTVGLSDRRSIGLSEYRTVGLQLRPPKSAYVVSKSAFVVSKSAFVVSKSAYVVSKSAYVMSKSVCVFFFSVCLNKHGFNEVCTDVSAMELPRPSPSPF